jgi:hypothetical protein
MIYLYALYRARATTHEFVLLKRPARAAAHRSCALRAPPYFFLAARTAARMPRALHRAFKFFLLRAFPRFTHSHT